MTYIYVKSIKPEKKFYTFYFRQFSWEFAYKRQYNSNDMLNYCKKK